MKPEEYVDLCLVTESKDAYPAAHLRMTYGENNEVLRLLHGSMGCVTESAELLDALKKFLMYGKDLDRRNVLEEMGDLLWYVSVLCDTMGVSYEQLWTMNIAKLRKRFGDKFTSARAINRDIDAEMRALDAAVAQTVSGSGTEGSSGS